MALLFMGLLKDILTAVITCGARILALISFTNPTNMSVILPYYLWENSVRFANSLLPTVVLYMDGQTLSHYFLQNS